MTIRTTEDTSRNSTSSTTVQAGGNVLPFRHITRTHDASRPKSTTALPATRDEADDNPGPPAA